MSWCSMVPAMVITKVTWGQQMNVVGLRLPPIHLHHTQYWYFLVWPFILSTHTSTWYSWRQAWWFLILEHLRWHTKHKPFFRYPHIPICSHIVCKCTCSTSSLVRCVGEDRLPRCLPAACAVLQERIELFSTKFVRVGLNDYSQESSQVFNKI